MSVRSPRSSAGFTIIEVMIVLAIAGLILLIVFEAIPTLERNGRNNQRKQDVQAILAAVSHYELNHSGNMPANCGIAPNFCNTPTGSLFYVKPTYYDFLTSGEVTITTTGLGILTPSFSPVTNPDKVQVYNHAKCDPSNQGSATAAGASYSDLVALYAVETGSSSVSPQCQQL